MDIPHSTRKFKLKNPYKPDEDIVQEVVIGREPFYNYEDSAWVSIDTEFLSLQLPYDQLCTIQIASPDPEDPGYMRVEIIWVWESLKTATIQVLQKFLVGLLTRKDIEIIMHVCSADLPRIEKLAFLEYKGKLFDTKVAAKIVMTNTNDHSMENIINSLIKPNFSKDKSRTSAQWDLAPEYWEDKMIEYAMNDVIYLHPAKLALERIAQRRGTGEILSDVMSIMPTIAHLHTRGYDESVLHY